MTTPHEQRRSNALRLIALTTNDTLARAVALDDLGESEDQARNELSQTCWADDMSNLRIAAEANFKSKVVEGKSGDCEVRDMVEEYRAEATEDEQRAQADYELWAETIQS